MADPTNTGQFGLGDRLALVGIVAGFAGTVAAMSLPLAYPDTQVWVWRIILWPSLFIMAGALFFLVADLVKRAQIGGLSAYLKSRIQAIGATLFVIAALVGVLWYAATITPNTSPPPIPPPEKPKPPPPALVSRSDKFIFGCNIPPPLNQTPEQFAQQKEVLRKQLKAWGETIGFTFTLSDIESGYRILIEAETLEARQRLAFAGVWPSITKVNMDVRRIGARMIVAIYAADLPKEMSFFAMMPADPTLPQIRSAEKQIGHLLGDDDACSLI